MNKSSAQQCSPTASEACEFVNLNGVILDTGFACISAYMKSRLTEGRYEVGESKVIPQLIEESDRILELGGGIGYLSSLLFKTGKCQKLIVIEAHPGLVPIIKRNHELNGVAATVMHGVPCSLADPSTHAFYVRENFWASSTSADDGDFIKMVDVPTINVSEVLPAHNITTLICDIEGAEVALFEWLDLGHLSKVAVEHHPAKTGESGKQDTRRRIMSRGFTLDENLSGAKLDVFLRCH
jgi:FkbM family methyltransferase